MDRIYRKGALLLVFLSSMAGTLVGGSPALAAPYYEGKTIEIIAATSPGGGTDLTARAVARFLPKYLPGTPRTIVRNQPGAGGVIAANSYYVMTKPDGLTLYHGSATVIASQQRKREIVRYDLRKMPFLGNIGAPGPVICVRKEALKRLKNPNAPPVIVGTRQGEETWNMMALYGKEILGWNVRWLPGFGGTGEIVLAFMRGEVDMFGNGQNVKNVVSEGIGEPLAQLGLMRGDKFIPRPDFPDTPVFPDLLGDKKPTGIAWEAYMSAIAPSYVFKFTTAAPNTPPEILNVLIGGYAKMAMDPQFNDMLRKNFAEEFEINTGKDSDMLLRAALDVSPEAMGYLRGLFRKYELEK